jgi:hypothetical protein
VRCFALLVVTLRRDLQVRCRRARRLFRLDHRGSAHLIQAEHLPRLSTLRP